MCFLRRLSILFLFLILVSLMSQRAWGRIDIPDSLLNKEWDMNLLKTPVMPWTVGCDSVISDAYSGEVFYYNVDTFYHQVATCELREISNSIRYFYFIISIIDKKKQIPIFREKLLKAIKKYKSKALEAELDVFDTHCFFLPSPDSGIEGMKWDYFWNLVMKYDKKGDKQTKLRIMEQLLSKTGGFFAGAVSTNIKKDHIPIIALINEILVTLDKMEGETYALAPSYFYTQIGLIYYHFKFYDKAIPLLWKASKLPIGHSVDRAVMMARDYLGDYYTQIGNYNLSDSLYLSILKSPDKIMLRPIDDVIAIGAIAFNANSRGWKEEALRLYSIIIPRALAYKDSTLAAGYALHLGRIYMEKGNLEKTRTLLNDAYRYLISGGLPFRNWERYYTLCRDYYLTINDSYRASCYIDSIAIAEQQREEHFDSLILAYAQQEEYELGMERQKEQIQKGFFTRSLIIIGLILCLALLIGVICYNRKLRAKNQALYLQIKKEENENKCIEETLSGNSRQHALFVRLQEYLQTDRNFAQSNIDANTLAVLLATNRTYLFESIKNCTGKTFQEYINTLRMEEAKRLLKTTDETVDNIALICGYNSARTFYRLFQSHYNLSPSIYRKMAQKEQISH